MDSSFDQYLAPAYYINSDDESIISKAKYLTQDIDNQLKKSIILFEYVRDSIFYNPYVIDFRPTYLRASAVLQKKQTHCVEKAILLAALARAVGIPSRLGFADVKNHIATEKLARQLGTNVLVFHGYAELWVAGRWNKLTVAFNKSLCEHLGVAVLHYDGTNDALFQEFDHGGNQFMEYLRDYGTFHDFPYDLFIRELEAAYPHLIPHAKLTADGGRVLDYSALEFS